MELKKILKWVILEANYVPQDIKEAAFDAYIGCVVSDFMPTAGAPQDKPMVFKVGKWEVTAEQYNDIVKHIRDGWIIRGIKALREYTKTPDNNSRDGFKFILLGAAKMAVEKLRDDIGIVYKFQPEGGLQVWGPNGLITSR